MVISARSPITLRRQPVKRLCGVDSLLAVADRVRFAVPQPTEWQGVRDQIDAAMIVAACATALAPGPA